MKTIIEQFASQFEFKPQIINPEKLGKFDSLIVVGMGGSHLAADLLKMVYPGSDIIVHRDYGLPSLPENKLKNTLVILSSYSGNTEETLVGYDLAKNKGLNMAAISIGGKLIEKAKMDHTPYIQMPDTGIQPRMALGFSLMGFVKFLGDEKTLQQLSLLPQTLHPERIETQGKELAEKLKGSVPVVYSSSKNMPMAYIWKIKFNETGKTPAFYNVFPELNHNEMIGFDVKDSTKDLSKNFYFLLLEDPEDHPKIKKRMEVLKKLYLDRGLRVEDLPLSGDDRFYKIFSCLSLADWTAFYTAEEYGVESEQVPMVEEFKKLIS